MNTFTYKHLLLIAAAAVLSACRSEPPEVVDRTFPMEGQDIRIIVPYAYADNVNNLIFQTRQKMGPLIKLFDPFAENSEISTINQVTGSSRVPVSKDTMRLLKHAVRFGQLSDGAFDITTPPLSMLWGFNEGIPPDDPLPDSVRDAALRSVGYDKIDLEGNSVQLTSPYTQIDVSSLTASYALDIVILHLRAQRVPTIYLQADRDTRVLGERRPGVPWTQPIIVPQTGQQIGIAEFSEMPAIHVAVPSNERVEMAGQTYYNNINPITGMAVNDNFLVITAAKSLTKAAALGHALVCHTVNQAQDIIDKFRDGHALIIPNGDPLQIWLSDGASTTFKIDPVLADSVQRGQITQR